MKVYIGPYKDYFGPYQLAEKLCFWAKPVKDEYGFMRSPDWVHDFGGKLADIKLLDKFLHWIDSKKKRKIQVRIDKYDTWSMDQTLSYIILPMLKQLKETKHGVPFICFEDVPESLFSEIPKEGLSPEEIEHQKLVIGWEWILDEIIWTFEQKTCDDSTEKFFKDDVIDMDGLNAHNERMSRGFILFGKYYHGLWD